MKFAKFAINYEQYWSGLDSSTRISDLTKDDLNIQTNFFGLLIFSRSWISQKTEIPFPVNRIWCVDDFDFFSIDLSNYFHIFALLQINFNSKVFLSENHSTKLVNGRKVHRTFFIWPTNNSIYIWSCTNKS